MLINDEIIINSQYKNNQSVYTLEFGPNVREIGEEAFADCNNLEKIILPDNIVVVKKGAFKNCKKLKELFFNKKTYFEKGVFYDCFNLQKIYIGQTMMRIFSLDSSHSYIISMLDNNLSTKEYSVYVGRYCDAASNFPATPPNLEQHEIYVVTINKNGIEYKWFHTDINIAFCGAKFLASNKTFENYFNIKLNEDTLISYNQFSLLVGTCFSGRRIWDFFCKTVNLDPNNKYSIKFILQVMGEDVPCITDRLKAMIEHKKETFSFLDFKTLISYYEITSQSIRWGRKYLGQWR